MTATWLSLLPALIAIPVAFITRRVLLALGLYVVIGALILEGGWLPDATTRVGEIVWEVVSDRDTILILTFSLFIGALVGLVQRAGGIEGFVHWVEAKLLRGHGQRVEWIPFITSMVLFIETYLGVLIAGMVALPLCNRYRVSRLRLSYILDTTCAPKCMLIPINAWGAYVIGLLVDQGVEEATTVLVGSLGLLFYGWLAIASVALIVAAGWEIPWQLHASRLPVGEKTHFDHMVTPAPTAPQDPRDLWRPVGLLVGGVLLLLPLLGDAPLAIFLAVTLSLLSTLFDYQRRGILPWREMVEPMWQGVKVILPVMVLLLFAFSVGLTTKLLGTGFYLAGVLEGELAPFWLPPLVFGVGCLMSFASGTSWGTFAILIPIVVPLAEAFEIPLPLLVGAALSGGLFGDHCSPVSDTTMVASLAAGVEPIDHIRHQLPYALMVAAAALLLYLVVGAVWLT